MMDIFTYVSFDCFYLVLRIIAIILIVVFDNKFRRGALNRLHFSVADDHFVRVCWIRDQVFILVFSTPVRSRSRLRTTLNHWLLASLRTHLPILHCPYLPLIIKCLL